MRSILQKFNHGIGIVVAEAQTVQPGSPAGNQCVGVGQVLEIGGPRHVRLQYIIDSV